jgi:hypothetical protein
MDGRRVSRSVILAAVIVLAGLAPPVNAVGATGGPPVTPMTVRGGNVGVHMVHHISLAQHLVGQGTLGSTGGICHDQLVVP